MIHCLLHFIASIVMASNADDQWSSFCSNVVVKWTGSCTFWDAHTHKVSSSFKANRSFMPLDEDKTVIRHENIFHNNDGSARQMPPEFTGPWKIHKEDTDMHGVCHPANKELRGVLHSNGGGAWTRRHLDTGPFPVEMFLCRGNFRCSVIVSYNESKKLRSFGTIREKKLDTQAEIWSSSTALQNSLLLPDLDKDFTGEEKTLDGNLQLHVVSECKWDKGFWLNGARETNDDMTAELTQITLPDNICLSCPSQLSSNSFILRSCIVFPHGEDNCQKAELQEVTVTFVDGFLRSVKQGIYH